MLNTKLVPGALHGAEISPDGLKELDALATSLTNALVQHMHADVRERGGKTITDADVERATLKLFGHEMGMTLVQHALSFRHRG